MEEWKKFPKLSVIPFPPVHHEGNESVLPIVINEKKNKEGDVKEKKRNRFNFLRWNQIV
jgi:hypothetical protein